MANRKPREDFMARHMPSPAEIEAATAQIRATWSATEEAARRVGGNPPAVVPLYVLRKGRRGKVVPKPLS